MATPGGPGGHESWPAPGQQPAGQPVPSWDPQTGQLPQVPPPQATGPTAGFGQPSGQPGPPPGQPAPPPGGYGQPGAPAPYTGPGGNVGTPPGTAGHPGWGAPPQGQPTAYPHGSGFGGQPPAGPSRGRNRALAIGGIACVLVLALVLALVAAWAGGDDDGASFENPEARRARVAATDLTAAANALAQEAGVRYTGTYRNNNDEVDVDARITNEGWTSAALTVNGQKVSVLSNGPHTYVKAGRAYWEENGAPRELLTDYSKSWVRVSADQLGIDLARLFSPGVLGADLELAVERDEVRGGDTTKLNGVEVREVITAQAVVYITTAEPQRVVKVVSDPAAAGPSPGGTGGGDVVPGHHNGSAGRDVVPADERTGSGAVPRRVRGPGDPDEFAFDVAGMKPEEVKELFTELEKRVKELKSSVDSQVTFSLDGGIRLKPCNVSACTATLSLSNSVTSDSPYLAVNRPVKASITIRITLDKKTVKVCRPSRTMKPNGSTKVSCRARYRVPADGRNHQIRATARAVATAAVDADIKKMFDDLKAEKERDAPPPLPGKDGDLGPNWVPCHPRTIALEEGSCEEKTAEIAEKIGGEIHMIRPPRGASTLSTYRGYEARWNSHDVVVKNGRVYDAWTGRYGEPIEVYKSRWFYRDELNFNF